MLKNFLKTFLKQKGAEVSDDELAWIDEIENKKNNKETKAETSTKDYNSNDDFKKQFDVVMRELQDLKKERDSYKSELSEVMKLLGEERQAREQSLKAILEKQEQEKKEKVDALIKYAIEKNKIAPQNEEVIQEWKSIAAENLDRAKKLIDNLPSLNTKSSNQQKQSLAPAEKSFNNIDLKIAQAGDEKVLNYVKKRFSEIDSN